jgi:hypothetical protein
MPQDTTCPLCDREASYHRLYTHLQTYHCKSDLSRALLDEVEESEPMRQSGYEHPEHRELTLNPT